MKHKFKILASALALTLILGIMSTIPVKASTTGPGDLPILRSSKVQRISSYDPGDLPILFRVNK